MENKWNQRFTFDNVAHDTPEPSLIVPPDTGKQLSDARKKLNLSVKDVADSLKLTEANVEAMENRQYDLLFNIAYATGYVRSYAKLVNLDADELIRNDHELGIVEIFDKNYDQPATRARIKYSTPVASWGAIAFRLLVIGVVLAGVIALWNNKDGLSTWWDRMTVGEPVITEPATEPLQEQPPINNLTEEPRDLQS